jgi:hypothetical protein
MTAGEPGPGPEVPPPVPPAKKKGLSTTAIVLIVLGAVGFLVVVGVVATVAIVVPKMKVQQQRVACLNNLSQLGQLQLMLAAEHPDRPPSHSGPALFLSYRKGGVEIRRGDERSLLCPADEKARLPETEDDRQAWDDVDLAHAPRSLCSYAVRDFERFPIDPKKGAREPIAACLNHEGIVVFVFSAGDAQFVKLHELGLATDDDKIVGPDSKSPLLRVLRFGDGSVR